MKERVRSGIASAEFEWPLRRITVNLAPAALRKEKRTFDGQKSQLKEIRKGLDGSSNAALERVEVNNELRAQTIESVPENYRLLGSVLIEQGTELTREALN